MSTLLQTCSYPGNIFVMYSFNLSTSDLVGHSMTRSHSHSGLAMLAWRSSYTQLMMSSSFHRVIDALSSIANSPSSGITGIFPSPMFSRNVAKYASPCCPPVACRIIMSSVRRILLSPSTGMNYSSIFLLSQCGFHVAMKASQHNAKSFNCIT